MTMKFYLAHPTLIRKQVREWELGFEERTGVELLNPFYDIAERDDISEIDKGNLSEYAEALDYRYIVEDDTRKLLMCDGLVAVLKFMPTMGTPMEIMIAKQFNRKVYAVVLDEEWAHHPWLKYFSDEIVTSFKSLELLFRAEGIIQTD